MSVAGTLSLVLFLACADSHAGEYFKITVVDDQTGRGVPLVELKTTNNICYYTDSNGVVAFSEPGLMHETVFFHVSSHGYEFPKDGFGYRGRRLEVVPGGEATLKIKRINVAQRLYRVTGAGAYRDSVLTGHPVPVRQPVLNGRVFGSDSVLGAVYRDRIYWFWGDTSRPSYPLGNFHVPGATSRLPADGGLDPEVGVDLDYFVDDKGFAKETARMPGQGPTWLGGLVTLTDDQRRERMFAGYAKVAPPMRVYERGLVEFNDDKKVFEKKVQFDLAAPLFPGGHPFKHVDDGVEYVYFSSAIPPIRVRATVEHLHHPSKYEAFTCLAAGSREDSFKLDRDEDGAPRYAWKADTAPLTRKIEEKLIKEGLLQLGGSLVQLREADTGKRFIPHGHSVYWNEYRKRWVMVVLETFGSPSFLGELWYAEADTPRGPWVYARKIVTHDKYSFYNPKQHPMFAKDGGRVIFFEATYSTFLAGVEVPTPRYDYNQLMYKLDLSDPRLVLPVPVYRVSDGSDGFGLFSWHDLPSQPYPTEIAFFALDRPKPGVVGVFAENTPDGRTVLKVGAATIAGSDRKAAPLFYGLPMELENPPATTVPLYEFVHKDGQTKRYAAGDWKAPSGYRRVDIPVCRVWRNPFAFKVRWK